MILWIETVWRKFFFSLHISYQSLEIYMIYEYEVCTFSSDSYTPINTNSWLLNDLKLHEVVNTIHKSKWQWRKFPLTRFTKYAAVKHHSSCPRVFTKNEIYFLKVCVIQQNQSLKRCLQWPPNANKAEKGIHFSTETVGQVYY